MSVQVTWGDHKLTPSPAGEDNEPAKANIASGPGFPLCDITQTSLVALALAIRNWPRNQRVWQNKTTGTGAKAKAKSGAGNSNLQPATVGNCICSKTRGNCSAMSGQLGQCLTQSLSSCWCCCCFLCCRSHGSLAIS